MDTRGPAAPYCCEDRLKSSSEADDNVLFHFSVYLFVCLYQDADTGGFCISPSHINACTPTHGTILSDRNPDTSWVTPTCQAIEKTPTSKCAGKTDMHSCHHPDFSTGLYNQQWTSNSQLLTEEKRVWTVHLALQLWRLPFKYWVHRTPSSENQWGLHKWVPRDCRKQSVHSQHVHKGLLWLLPGSAQRGQAKVPTPQWFPGRSSTAYITRCSWRASF